MDPQTLILSALKTGVALTVCALGLSASAAGATYVLRRPRRLLQSLLAMNVIMPLFAAGLVAAFDLHPPVKLALVALAVSPIPPLLPRRALRAGGGASYTIGLLVAAALLAIVFVPLAVDLLGTAFGRPAQMSPAAVAPIVGVTVLVPLAIGLLVRRLAPCLAERAARPLSVTALGILFLALLPVLITTLPAAWSLVGNGTLAALVAFVVAGLGAGHLLGGPEPEDRTVLALATSSRHPGIAVAIAHANFPHERDVLLAVVLYLLVNAVVSLPYLLWRRHGRGMNAQAEEPPPP